MPATHCSKCATPLGQDRVKNRCRDCYNEYMREYMLNRYYKRRAVAIEQLGGHCIDCYTEENLELDHADATYKSFSISKIWNYSDGRFEKELEKCVLRCEDCHLLKTQECNDNNTVEHGGGTSGKKNCKCEPCRKRKQEYMREYMKTHTRKRDRI